MSIAENTSPTPVAPRVIYEGERATQRLLALGIEQDDLVGAVLDGDDGRRACTPFHPRQAAGQRMWLDATAGLRRRTVARGSHWKLDRTNNLETAVNLQTGTAIAVMGGDEFTGHRGEKDPRVRRQRGPATVSRVKANLDWMPKLFSMPEDIKADELGSLPVRLLLIRAAEDFLYVELSLPTGMNKSNFVTAWGERILIPRIPIVGGVTPLEDGDDDSDFVVVEK